MTKKIYVVGAAILNEQHQILASKRSDDRILGALWEFPGGKMEEGESPQEALRREIREELDAKIEIGDLLETVEWDYPEFHLTMHCYFCTLLSESVHLNEHDAAVWLTKDTLNSVKWLPADEGLIKRLQATL